MGNALQLSSCTSCGSADIMCMTRVNNGCRGGAAAAAEGGVRVVHTGTGEVVEASEGVTAAEVMVEHPNHFVICSTSKGLAAAGKRFEVLAAHQELLHNHLYFLFPMHKLRARVSQQDLALLAHLTHKLKLHRAPPAFSLAASSPSSADHLSTSARPHFAEQSLLSSFINRSPLPPGLYWRPSLQTIHETPHLRSSTFRLGLVKIGVA